MIPVKFENISNSEHHTVRVTPVNGETVDPTTLKGAAFWSDDLSMCLAPLPADDGCYGRTDRTRVIIPGDVDILINDIYIGRFLDSLEGISDALTVRTLEDGYDIENITNECVRLTFSSTNDDVQYSEANVIFGQIYPAPYYMFNESNPYIFEIHLAPSRIDKVSIDSQWVTSAGDVNSGIHQVGGTTITYSLTTNSLLPATGIGFTVDGTHYTIPYGTKKFDFDLVLPENNTNYATNYTPVIEFDNPEYLVGGSADSFTYIPIRGEKFKRNTDIVVVSAYGRTATIGENDTSVSFSDDEIYLPTYTSVTEFIIQFDPSFAGAEVCVYADYTLQPHLGTIDSNGRAALKMPEQWLIRKDNSVGMYLRDPGRTDAFFWFSGIYAYGTAPFVYTANGLSLSTSRLDGYLDAGFDGPFRIYNIPSEITEIEVGNDSWQHASSIYTPFYTPKRVTRSADGSFYVPTDIPQATYSSDAGGWAYYNNYVQVTFVVDGELTRRKMWLNYRLNVYSTKG